MEDYSYLKFDKIGKKIVGCDKNVTRVVIPERVTRIGDYAFMGCTSLTSIEIPNNVTRIGRSAFSGCTSLTSIEIPNSVKRIGLYAFSDCTSLTSIEIPNSVTSIGNKAFSKCTSLTSIVIPNSVTIFGSNDDITHHLTSEGISSYTLFFGCTSLACLVKIDKTDKIFECQHKTVTNVVIPKGITIIGDNAFGFCTFLTSVEIPNSVTSIGNSAFYCTSLTSIEIPNSVTSIGNYAFSGCTSLTSIEIPSSVTSIGNGAFEGCTSLEVFSVSDNHTHFTVVDGVLFSKDLTKLVCYPARKQGDYKIPNGVTSIENHAFYGCTSPTSIEIPNSVTSIGDKAFYGCTSLTSIEIPDSVTSLGTEVFRGCTNLKEIHLRHEYPEDIIFRLAPSDTNAFPVINAFSYLTECTLYVPIGAEDAYRDDIEFKVFKEIKTEQ